MTTTFLPDTVVTFLHHPADDDGGIDFDHAVRCVGRLVTMTDTEWDVELYAYGNRTYLPNAEGLGNTPQREDFWTGRVSSARTLPTPAPVAGQDDNLDHPVTDWQYEVANGDTRLGYTAWLTGRLADDIDNGS